MIDSSTSHKSTPSRLLTRDYHAILRHQEEVGNDDTPSEAPERKNSTWPAIARVGAGFGVAAILSPLVLLIGDASPNQLVTTLLVTTAVGVLGVYIGHLITRREIRSWVYNMMHRTEKMFSGKDQTSLQDHDDFEAYLGELATNMERTLESQLRNERDAIIATIMSLISALEARDPYTLNHSTRVGRLSVRVGKILNLSHSELYELHLGGVLHDLGKIGIPDAILLKPGGLTTEEYEIMKTHSTLGARILSGIPGLEMVADIVLGHHEMYDGRGYPNGLAGEEIPLGARIVSVCDTFLSMAEDRPYRSGRTPDRVFREMNRVAGSQLDPKLVSIFESMLKEDPSEFENLSSLVDPGSTPPSEQDIAA